MKLRSSPPSPFGRKVKIAAIMLGLMDRIEILATDTNDPGDAIRRDNPLGKIPCLVTDDGTSLYDSRVIVDYLDSLAGGGRIIPLTGQKRYQALVGQALADGIMDAALLLVYETRFREASHYSEKWLDHHRGKIDRGLDALAANPPSGERDIAHIATACAFGYLDLRLGGEWRKTHPALVSWLDAFAATVPAFEKTRFVQT